MHEDNDGIMHPETNQIREVVVDNGIAYSRRIFGMTKVRTHGPIDGDESLSEQLEAMGL